MSNSSRSNPKLKVKDLIKMLGKVQDKNKDVFVLLFVQDEKGCLTRCTNDQNKAISLGGCGGVEEFDNYVAIKRTV